MFSFFYFWVIIIVILFKFIAFFNIPAPVVFSDVTFQDSMVKITAMGSEERTFSIGDIKELARGSGSEFEIKLKFNRFPSIDGVEDLADLVLNVQNPAYVIQSFEHLRLMPINSESASELLSDDLLSKIRAKEIPGLATFSPVGVEKVVYNGDKPHIHYFSKGSFAIKKGRDKTGTDYYRAYTYNDYSRLDIDFIAKTANVVIDVEKISQCLESAEISNLDLCKGDYETSYVIARTTQGSAYPFYLKNVVGVDYDVSGELSKIILKSDPGTAVLEVDIAQTTYDLRVDG